MAARPAVTTHAAVVLAAGGSTRLGRSKQLLTRDGETLVHRAVRLAAATAPARLLLVVGADAQDVRAAVASCPVEVVVNARWRQGLSSSVEAAAQALSRDVPQVERCLLLLCDQPALEVAHLHALLREAGGAASGCAATVHGAHLGVPAVVPLVMLARRGTGDAGLRATLNALPAGAVARLQAPELGHDIDTPGQLAAAIAAGWVDEP